MIKLIASDVDGTLVPDGEKTMVPAVFDMIRDCRSAGIAFVVASGRPYPALKKTFAPVRDDVIFVADSGALVVYRDEVLYRNNIDPALGRRIMEDIQRRKHCEFMLSAGPDYVVIQPKGLIYRLAMQRFMGKDIRIIRHLDEAPEEYQKLSVFVYNKKANEVVPALKQAWGAEIPVLAAGRMWVDFCNAGKEHAIQAIMDRMNIQPDELMVFGDSENDMGMMRLAGHAYAMESAAPEVKAVCGHTCRAVPDVVFGLLREQG